ncbi:MAG: polyhydroxyalkanoic acid system family protein [Usitatibacter sp.]
MADIEIHRAHGLGLKAARTAADRMAETLGRKLDLKGAWNGNVLRFERPGVSGSLAISDKDLNLSVGLGFLLKAMKGSIQAAIEQELDQLFARAHAEPAAAPKTKPAAAKKPATGPKKGG